MHAQSELKKVCLLKRTSYKITSILYQEDGLIVEYFAIFLSVICTKINQNKSLPQLTENIAHSVQLTVQFETIHFQSSVIRLSQ